MKICSVISCEREAIARGYCGKHWQRWSKYGYPTIITQRERGMGGLSEKGYIMKTFDGKRKKEHIAIVEKVLGYELPKGVVVHHIDEIESNNLKNNLVICQDDSYHKIIHQRMRAYKDCGHANWRKCKFCKEYDKPENLVIRERSSIYHSSCKNEYARLNRNKNMGVI